VTPREALAAAYVAGAVGVLQEPWGVSLADWLQTAEGKEALAAVGEGPGVVRLSTSADVVGAGSYANPVSITKRTASGLTTSTDGGKTWTEEEA